MWPQMLGPYDEERARGEAQPACGGWAIGFRTHAESRDFLRRYADAGRDGTRAALVAQLQAACWGDDWTEALDEDEAANAAQDEALQARGFDKGRGGCSQCAALSINGLPTHETGCPNASRARRLAAAEEDDTEEDDGGGETCGALNRGYGAEGGQCAECVEDEDAEPEALRLGQFDSLDAMVDAIEADNLRGQS